MNRLARLVLTLSAMIGFSSGAPAKIQAGVIPWTYDAIFGPVGSMRTNAYYRQAYWSGYAPSTSYAPMSASYAPTTVAYTPTSYASYGSGGSGCSCNQSSSYYPSVSSSSFYSDAYSYNGLSGCSSCGTAGYNSYGATGCSSCGSSGYGYAGGGSGCSSCASGNCSAGYGSTPSTAGYGSGSVSGPSPDPNYNNQGTSDLNNRINELEHQLRVLDHRQKEDEKFLDREYQGKYTPSPYSSGTYNRGGSSNTYGSDRSDRSETVPPRQRRDSFDSNNDTVYPPRRRAPVQDPQEQDTRKPILGAPAPAPAPAFDPQEDKTESKPKSSGNSNETEPQALNLDNRVTSRAIAPRERLVIVTKQSKLQTIAKSNKRTLQTSEIHPSTELAHH